jgi:zinc transport system ATP-binding protein
MPLLECQGLAFAYSGQTVVSGLDFCLELGDYLCVVGENGSGKSTLVEGILGLRRPSSGRICFAAGLSRREIGFLPQASGSRRDFPANVLEVVLSGRLGHKRAAPFFGKGDRQAALAALAMTGMADRAYAYFGTLSGGQRQRVLLARALSIAPDGLKLLILDEPMNGLDPAAKNDLYVLIDQLNKSQGVTVMMVTHDVNTALHFANKVLLLGQKQLFFGPVDEFKQQVAARELLRDACASHCAVCGLGHLEQAWTQ